jgi:protein TonB
MALGKLNIFESNWVDLIFKGRNQSYGAYVLRKRSDEYTTKGIIFAIIFFSAAISAPVVVSYLESIVPKEKVIKTTEVVLEEPPPIDKNEPPPPPPPEPPPLKSTVKFTPPEIKPDVEVPDEPPPTQEEMKDKEADVKTEEGDPNGVDQSLLETGDGVTGEENVILTFAEQMPEFPGGAEELMHFLHKNTNYPPNARENGVDGRVILQFVVGTDGKISNIEVVKGRGWGLDEEAVRVVKMMPPWKPGKQNGKPVTVKFTLPFQFKLGN